MALAALQVPTVSPKGVSPMKAVVFHGVGDIRFEAVRDLRH
jgi:hypothetical protein